MGEITVKRNQVSSSKQFESLFPLGVITSREKQFCWVSVERNYNYRTDEEENDRIKMSFSLKFTLAALILLAISSSLVLCEGTEENMRVHNRVRRMTGYRQKCVHVKRKLCAFFTHNGISKPFCFPIKIKECTGLDK